MKHDFRNIVVLQNIQTEEFKLQQESRLLSLDSKRNDLEYKKRLYPGADLSHEEMTVQKLKKYLVNMVKLCRSCMSSTESGSSEISSST